MLPSAFTSAPNDLQVGNTAVISTAEVVGLSPRRSSTRSRRRRCGRTARRSPPRTSCGPGTSAARTAWSPTSGTGRSPGCTPGRRERRSRCASAPRTRTGSRSSTRLSRPAPTARPARRLRLRSTRASGPYEIEAASTTGSSSSRTRLARQPADVHARHGGRRPHGHAGPGGPLRAVYVPSVIAAEIEAMAGRGLYDARTSLSNTIVSLDFAVRGPDAFPPDVRAGVAHLVDRQAIVNQLAGPVNAAVGASASHLVGPGQSSYPGSTGVPVGLASASPQAPVPAGSTGARPTRRVRNQHWPLRSSTHRSLLEGRVLWLSIDHRNPVCVPRRPHGQPPDGSCGVADCRPAP